MPRRRDWRRERLLLLLLLLAIAPVVWAMLVAVAFAAIRPDRLPLEPPPPPTTVIEVHLTLSVTDNRVDASVTFTAPDAGGARDAKVNWGDGAPETTLLAETSPIEVCHLYDEPGEYTVVATVSDSGGLVTSAEVTVVVGPANPYRNPDERHECSGSSALGAR